MIGNDWDAALGMEWKVEEDPQGASGRELVCCALMLISPGRVRGIKSKSDDWKGVTGDPNVPRGPEKQLIAEIQGDKFLTGGRGEHGDKHLHAELGLH
jgi:hypothetical protein